MQKVIMNYQVFVRRQSEQKPFYETAIDEEWDAALANKINRKVTVIRA